MRMKSVGTTRGVGASMVVGADQSTLATASAQATHCVLRICVEGFMGNAPFAVAGFSVRCPLDLDMMQALWGFFALAPGAVGQPVAAKSEVAWPVRGLDPRDGVCSGRRVVDRYEWACEAALGAFKASARPPPPRRGADFVVGKSWAENRAALKKGVMTRAKVEQFVLEFVKYFPGPAAKVSRAMALCFLTPHTARPRGPA